MKIWWRFFSLILSCSLIISLFGCQHSACRDETDPFTIEGKLYVVGNEPFTELALETSEGKVYTVRGDFVSELKGLQGQWVKLKGELIIDQHFLYSSEGFLVEEYERTGAREKE